METILMHGEGWKTPEAYDGKCKIINIISGYAMHKRFIAVHTTMNKVTGVLLFIVPLTLSIVPLIYTGILICSVATFAAVQEGHFIRTGKGD